MSENMGKDTNSAFEEALANAANNHFTLRLYIAGNTHRSVEAIKNLQKICEEYLEGRYTLEVIDLHQQPSAAREDQILATPTLVKILPLPLRRIIGDLATTERVLVGLGLDERATGGQPAEAENATSD